MPDPEVLALIEQTAAKAGIARRSFDERRRSSSGRIYALDQRRRARPRRRPGAARRGHRRRLRERLRLSGVARRADVLRRSSSACRPIYERVAAFHRDLGDRVGPGAAARAPRTRGLDVSRVRRSPRRPARGRASVSTISSARHGVGASPASAIRPVNVADADTVLRHGADGTIYVQSPQALGPYPTRLTDRLEHWAAVAPDRTFLAQRRRVRTATGGTCPTATHSSACAGSRRRLLRRQLSVERPILILSGNGIDHGLLALAAMLRRGALRADRARLLAAGDRLRHAAAGVRAAAARPGVRRRRGAVRSEPLRARPAGRHRAGRVDCRRRQDSRRRRFADSRGDARRRRSMPPATLSDPTRSPRFSSRRDRPGGRRASSTRSGCSAPTRRCSRSVLRFLARRAAGPVRLVAVESHGGRQPQLRSRPAQRRHALHRRGQADAGARSRRRCATCARSPCTAHFAVPRVYEMLMPHLRSDPVLRDDVLQPPEAALLRRRRTGPALLGRAARGVASTRAAKRS